MPYSGPEWDGSDSCDSNFLDQPEVVRHYPHGGNPQGIFGGTVEKNTHCHRDPGDEHHDKVTPTFHDGDHGDEHHCDQHPLRSKL